MGDTEADKCDFCQNVGLVGRTYLKPSKYVKDVADISANTKLYNEGDYFIIIKTCSDCGVPKI